jgi:hypothetical protein
MISYQSANHLRTLRKPHTTQKKNCKFPFPSPKFPQTKLGLAYQGFSGF